VAYLSGTLKTAIQATADVAGTLDKITLGSTGSLAKYPTGDSTPQFQLQTGSAWLGSPSIVQYIVNAIGTELDTYHICWGFITTNAAGIDPTLQANKGVTSLGKNAALDTITVTLTNPYTNNYYFAIGKFLDTTPVLCTIAPPTSDTLVFRAYDTAGVQSIIDNRSLCFATIGKI